MQFSFLSFRQVKTSLIGIEKSCTLFLGRRSYLVISCESYVHVVQPLYHDHDRNPQIDLTPLSSPTTLSFLLSGRSPLVLSRSGMSLGDCPDQFGVLSSPSIGKKTPSTSSSIFLELKPGLEIPRSNRPIGADECLSPLA